MAVNIKKKEDTIVIELAKAKSYTHYTYDMTFVEGGKYTFNESDARELLALKDEWGVPYFRRWQPPKPKEETLPEGHVAEGSVQSLPKGNDISMADIDPDRAKKQAPRKKRAPKVVAKEEPAPEETPEPAGEVDSGEIDTAGGVEV